jgi:hypothetical protein
MKTKVALTFAIVLILVGSSIAFSQDLRIRFPKGRTSATINGRIGNGGRICYFARARQGQTLTATVSSRSGKVQIFESGETSYSYVIEQTGEQSVCVDNLSRATTYLLTVSIR